MVSYHTIPLVNAYVLYISNNGIKQYSLLVHLYAYITILWCGDNDNIFPIWFIYSNCIIPYLPPGWDTTIQSNRFTLTYKVVSRRLDIVTKSLCKSSLTVNNSGLWVVIRVGDGRFGPEDEGGREGARAGLLAGHASVCA